MKKEQVEIWQNIAAFKLDDTDAARPFSKKLGEENKWSEELTLRIIAEYKKFLFLCVTLPKGASPSPLVDEAWHLHLTYTENYWDELCGKTLKMPLHHKPSKGGTSENHKHTEWYTETLVAYVQNFGLPPQDIWVYPHNFNPTHFLPNDSPFFIQKKENIFGLEKNNIKLNQNAQNTDLSREYREGVNDLALEIYEEGNTTNAQIWQYAAFGLTALLIIAVLYPPLLKGVTFLLPLSLLGFCIVVFISDYCQQTKQDLMLQIENLSDTLSPYLGAWVLGDKGRLITTWLYEATHSIQFDEATKRIHFTLKQNADLPNNPLYNILQTVEKNNVPYQLANDATQSYHTHIKAEVDRKGFVPQAISSSLIGFIITFFGIAFTRMMEGHHFGKPITFLIVTTLLFAVIFVATYFLNTSSFEDWRNDFHQKYASVSRDKGDLWSFALGTHAVIGTMTWFSYENYIAQKQQNSMSGDGGSSGCGSSGGDGGSSCGGSSCGGGCGGCGGGCGS
jgi:hypothetical protein